MPPLQRNFLVYDLETSGRDFKEGAEIVQIGATVLKYSDYSFHPVGNFVQLIKPQNPEKAEQGAIDVIGKDLWEKAQAEGEHPKVVLRKFREYMDSVNMKNKYWTAPIRVGFNNNSFDDPFLEYMMIKYKVMKNRDDMSWAYFSMDLLPLLCTVFGKDNLPNQKLDTFLELLGMSRDTEFHDGAEDAQKTAMMFQRYMRFMNNHIRPKIKIDNKQET